MSHFREADAKLFADFFNLMPIDVLRDDVPGEMQRRIGEFMFANGYRMVFNRWYLQEAPARCEPTGEQS